jgi:hypothetical protein
MWLEGFIYINLKLIQINCISPLMFSELSFYRLC